MKTIEKKEPYLNILNTQGNIYEEFLPDQVLTHKNLNKVVNYFEDQDRLSRIYLIGVGIGCGINIVSYSNAHIEIGQGVGVTTDGDIIKTETRRFQYYSELIDRADYALFEGRQVYEIYEQEGAGRLLDELPLTSFNSNEPGSLKDYIVLAYVENYTEDEGLCGGSGCDETGNKVYSNIKFLLTHKDNYQALISEDTIYQSHDVLSYYDTLPELCMPRLLLTKSNTTSGIAIHDQFKSSFYLKNELYSGITTIIKRFAHRINFAKFGITIPQITAYFDDIFNVQQEQFIQYKYDLLKDLIDTYREIRELILHTRFECVANVKAFPKHLLLGTLAEQTRLQTRHDFYPSPTVSENDQNLLAIRALCIKFFNQLKEYKIPTASSAAIKVTPSKGYEFKLSERSIPYYYETKNSLITNWNPVSIEQRKPKNQLGYHVSNLKNISCIQEPLKYSHLDKDFYRIEGHLGKDFRLALRKINNLKAKYNLAFDVKAISIGFPVNKVSLDDDKCDTKDYAILLKTWEQEFCCTAESATEFFQKYQYDNLGDNDTSTSVYYGYANYQPMYVLELLNKRKKIANATEETTNVDKIAAKLNVNTASEAVQAEQRYETSIQYAMDQAYQYVGNQNVPAGYISGIALGIIEELTGNVDQNDDYFFYTESAVKIVAGLSEIKRLFLKSLNEIYNTEKWTALNNAIDLLCADVDQVLFAISEAGENSTFGSRTHDKMYEYFIYDLSKLCCLKEKFTWLKEQIDDIRYDIYRELILSRLIEKHPGLEHMAGVPKGGTFLMVYLGGTEELLEDDSVLRQFNGIVQFDFALPYMCCSDCPPETVVYNQEPETTLVISKTKYCLPEDEGLVDFIAQSSGDAVITSPQGEGFIVETENGYAFDPTAVPDELLGETLTFLVDGKMPTTPVEIYVYRFPTDITANYTSPMWTDAGLTFDLNVTHEELSYSYNFTYTWKRADGTEIGTGTDLSEILIENEEDTIEETLTVTIGIAGEPVACTVITEVLINESRPIDITIQIPEIICHKLRETTVSWIPIFITPEDGTLTSPQQPVELPSFIEQNNEGNYFIDPVKVPDALVGDEIEFMINDVLVENQTTRIGRLPANINSNIEPYQIIGWDESGVMLNIRAVHNYQTENYIQYRWVEVDDNNFETEIGTTQNLTNFRIEDHGEGVITVNYRVEMHVIGLEDLCRESFSVSFTIERPSLEIPRGICFGQSIILEVSPNAEITTSLEENPIQNNQGTITFESELVPDSSIGQPIDISIDGSFAASTVVYKIPSEENINADDEFVRWEGNDVIVKLVANYEVSGVNNPEEYLEAKWFDNNGNQVENINEHKIPSDGGVVNTTYTVIICVKGELMDEDPCRTNVIEVPINHELPSLDLQDRYCWKEGEEEVKIPLGISPSEVDLTSPEGSNFIINEGDDYTFNISTALQGHGQRVINFEIEGNNVGTTTLFKLPKDASIIHDEEDSDWVSDGYIFTIKHDLSTEDYFNYDLVLLPENQSLNPIATNPNRYKLFANEFVNQRIQVKITVNGVSCTSENLITVGSENPNPVDPTEPTNPTTFERLVCEEPYAERLNILNVNNDLSGLERQFESQQFGEAINTRIITPMKNIVKVIERSSNMVSDSVNAINQINEMRNELTLKYLRNSNFSGDKKEILLLDELLELMSLELMRCLNENNNEIANVFNNLISISSDRIGDYGEITRTSISVGYLETFKTKGVDFQNTLNNTFLNTKNR